MCEVTCFPIFVGTSTSFQAFSHYGYFREWSGEVPGGARVPGDLDLDGGQSHDPMASAAHRHPGGEPRDGRYGLQCT